MQNETTVLKWGNSLAVRLPRGVSKKAGIGVGDRLAVTANEDGSIVLRSTRKLYELSDLVSRITPKNRHGETDWGKAKGEESR
jgi:antitoxin MazE